jgi:Leucine-rich repeat (LRR) protein
MKKIHYNTVFILLLISTLIFIYCLGIAVPDKTLLPLNPQDSLAVRAILDSNGLSYINLGDYDDRKRVLEQRESFIVKIQFDSFNLDRFRFISEFVVLDSLASLKLNNNNINNIQADDTITFKQLMIVDLSYNKLDSFPDQLLRVNNVEALYMDNNNLVSLPLEIMQKPYQLFTVKYNKLTNLPDTLKAWLSQYDPNWEKYQSN